jgi:hypothetical protein
LELSGAINTSVAFGNLLAIGTVLGTLELCQTAALVAIGELNAFLTGIVVQRNSVSNKLGLIAKEASDRIQEWLMQIITSLPEKTSELVSCNIVGTTYYRWDLDTNYAPTLVFIFQEVKEGQRESFALS